LQANARKVVPDGPDWIHEVKYDGYRGRVVRDGDVVKLLSKAGLDWTWRFPMIVEAARKMKQSSSSSTARSCVLDLRGISQFDWLHSGRYNDDAQLYAFDIVAIDGDDLRDCRWPSASSRLAKILERRPEGSSWRRSRPARSGPAVRCGVPNGPGRDRLQAPRARLPAADLRLGQGQEPVASGVLPRLRSVRVSRRGVLV
jgi:ATP-dependent DNA ligase